MSPEGGAGRRGPADRSPPRQPEADPLDAVGTFPVRGRVLDPDGKPVAGAEIFVRHNTEFGWSAVDPAPKGQKGRVAASDADGRFRFDLDKASSDWPYGDEPAWHQAQIAAVVPGLAMAWVEAGSLLKGDEATLRLVRDDVPIRGRVVDPQGRPIAGATVRLRQIATVKDGADLDAMLASGELEQRPDRGLVRRLRRHDLAGRPEHLDDRRRRPVRGQGRRARPHRLAGDPGPDAGG